MLEGIGLNVIACEPDALALARAIIPRDAIAPQMVIDMGTKSTDLVIAANGSPCLMRNIPTGTDTILKAAIQNLNIDSKQAEQFVYKFGLNKGQTGGADI